MSGKFKVLLIYPNLMMVNLMPTSIGVLAACLKKNGFDIKLFDTTHYNIEQESVDEIRVKHMQLRKFDYSKRGVEYKKTDVFDDFVKLVDDYRPDLLAVTVVEDMYPLANKLIAKVRDKRIPVVFGGVLPTFASEEVIESPDVDIICVGEGEEAIVELCGKLSSGEDITRIKNLWVKKNGRVYKNELRELVDLNRLPIEDFTVFEDVRLYRPMQGKVYRMIPIATDRGCPYLCKFCCSPTTNRMYRDRSLGNYFRFKTIDRIMEEIEYLVDRHSAEYIYINTDTFLIRSASQLAEFGRRYKKIGLPFWCQSRVETITDEKIKILKDMNLDRMSIGIEHGNEKFRKEYLDKTFTNEQAIEALKILEKNKVNVTVNNIIGFPDETRELVFDTINLNRRFFVDSINALTFVPYKGTYLREYSIEKGYLDPAAQTNSVIRNSILNMPGFSKEEIYGLIRTFPLYVKMPEKYFDRVRIAEQLNDEGDKALDELREIYCKEYF